MLLQRRSFAPLNRAEKAAKEEEEERAGGGGGGGGGSGGEGMKKWRTRNVKPSWLLKAVLRGQCSYC